jgi:hypothetical protein
MVKMSIPRSPNSRRIMGKTKDSAKMANANRANISGAKLSPRYHITLDKKTRMKCKPNKMVIDTKTKVGK